MTTMNTPHLHVLNVVCEFIKDTPMGCLLWEFRRKTTVCNCVVWDCCLWVFWLPTSLTIVVESQSGVLVAADKSRSAGETTLTLGDDDLDPVNAAVAVSNDMTNPNNSYNISDKVQNSDAVQSFIPSDLTVNIGDLQTKGQIDCADQTSDVQKANLNNLTAKGSKSVHDELNNIPRENRGHRDISSLMSPSDYLHLNVANAVNEEIVATENNVTTGYTGTVGGLPENVMTDAAAECSASSSVNDDEKQNAGAAADRHDIKLNVQREAGCDSALPGQATLTHNQLLFDAGVPDAHDDNRPDIAKAEQGTFDVAVSPSAAEGETPVVSSNTSVVSSTGATDGMAQYMEEYGNKTVPSNNELTIAKSPVHHDICHDSGAKPSAVSPISPENHGAKPSAVSPVDLDSTLTSAATKTVQGKARVMDFIWVLGMVIWVEHWFSIWCW